MLKFVCSLIFRLVFRENRDQLNCQVLYNFIILFQGKSDSQTRDMPRFSISDEWKIALSTWRIIYLDSRLRLFNILVWSRLWRSLLLDGLWLSLLFVCIRLLRWLFLLFVWSWFLLSLLFIWSWFWLSLFLSICTDIACSNFILPLSRHFIVFPNN